MGRWTGNAPAWAGAGVGTTPGFTTTVVASGEGPGARATLGGGTEGAAGPATAGAVIARAVTAADCIDWTGLTSCADGPVAVLCATENTLTSPGDEAGGLNDGMVCDSKRGTVPDLSAALGGDATLGGTLWLLAAGPDAGARAVGLLLSILAGPLAKGLVEGEDKIRGTGGALGLGESLGLMEGPHNPTDHRDGGVNSSPRNRFARGERPGAVEGAGDIARVPGIRGLVSTSP